MFERLSNIKITPVSLLHYHKLFQRLLLFLLGVSLYVFYVITKSSGELLQSQVGTIVTVFIGGYFMVEMFFRLIPSPLESMGSQKQFEKNLIRSHVPEPMIQERHITIIVAVSWILLNGILGALHIVGILDTGIMYLICLLYSVFDMVCILFFCPFQAVFMKNKCCGTCRIYNWDYAMMFTPLLFTPSIPAYILFGMSFIVLIVWEVRLHRYPERFSEATNEKLSCENCNEKLCSHKKHLMAFLAQNKTALHNKGEFLTGKLRNELAEKQMLSRNLLTKGDPGITDISKNSSAK